MLDYGNARGVKSIWEKKVRKLVSKPEYQSVIHTKWVFKNKMDKSSVVVTDIVRLVAQ